MSRVRPILFGTDMVRAILDGRKTVARRVAKKIPVETHRIEVNLRPETFKGIEVKEFECHWGGYQPDTGGFVDGCCIVKPPCQPGDILYVRETWKIMRAKRFDALVDIKFKAGGRKTIYFPNGGTDSVNREEYDVFIEKWDKNCFHPSIHMPKKAARIWLKVTDVKVELLQDITNEQILKEGANPEAIEHYIKQMPEESEEWIHLAHVIEFKHLWDSNIKKADLDRYGCDANPWVWVIEFERCEKPEGWPA